MRLDHLLSKEKNLTLFSFEWPVLEVGSGEIRVSFKSFLSLKRLFLLRFVL